MISKVKGTKFLLSCQVTRAECEIELERERFQQDIVRLDLMHSIGSGISGISLWSCPGWGAMPEINQLGPSALGLITVDDQDHWYHRTMTSNSFGGSQSSVKRPEWSSVPSNLSPRFAPFTVRRTLKSRHTANTLEVSWSTLSATFPMDCLISVLCCRASVIRKEVTSPESRRNDMVKNSFTLGVLSQCPYLFIYWQRIPSVPCKVSYLWQLQ